MNPHPPGWRPGALDPLGATVAFLAPMRDGLEPHLHPLRPPRRGSQAWKTPPSTDGPVRLSGSSHRLWRKILESNQTPEGALLFSRQVEYPYSLSSILAERTGIEPDPRRGAPAFKAGWTPCPLRSVTAKCRSPSGASYDPGSGLAARPWSVGRRS